MNHTRQETLWAPSITEIRLRVLSRPGPALWAYPGGKQAVAADLIDRWWPSTGASLLVEPFLGGGAVAISAGRRGIPVVGCEADPLVALVWRTVTNPSAARRLVDELDALADVTRDDVLALRDARSGSGRTWAELHDLSIPEPRRAALVLLRQRWAHRRSLVPGTGVQQDRNARWTTSRLAVAVAEIADLAAAGLLTVHEGDGHDLAATHHDRSRSVCILDPPYPVAGTALYPRGKARWDLLAQLVATAANPSWLMCSNDDRAGITRDVAYRHRLAVGQWAPNELLLAQDLDWATPEVNATAA